MFGHRLATDVYRSLLFGPPGLVFFCFYKTIRKKPRYVEYDLNNAIWDSESEYSGEDDVEEEADNYVKKKSKVAESSDGDDEYRGEEEDEAEEDDDDDGDGDDDDDDEEDYVGSSDEEEYDRRRRSLKHTVSGRKRGRSRDIEQEGLRRSQRANKSHVNYSKYEESDVEGDEDMEDSESRETSDSDERRVDNREDIDDIDDNTEKEFQCTTQCPDEKNNKMLSSLVCLLFTWIHSKWERRILNFFTIIFNL